MNIGAMQLNRGEVVKGILVRSDGGMDEGHQDIADYCTVLGFKEEAIFSVQHAAFNESLDDIVGKRCSGHPQKESQLRPAPLHVANGLTKPAIGLSLSTLDLVAAPDFERIDDRAAKLLMVGKPCLWIHTHVSSNGVVVVDHANLGDHVFDLGRELIYEIYEAAASVSQTISEQDHELLGEFLRRRGAVHHEDGRGHAGRALSEKARHIFTGMFSAAEEQSDFPFFYPGNDRGREDAHTVFFRIKPLILLHKVENATRRIVRMKALTRSSKPNEFLVDFISTVGDFITVLELDAISDGNSEVGLHFLQAVVGKSIAIAQERRDSFGRFIPALGCDTFGERSFEHLAADGAPEFFRFVDGRRDGRVARKFHKKAVVDRPMKGALLAIRTKLTRFQAVVGAEDPVRPAIVGGWPSAVILLRGFRVVAGFLVTVFFDATFRLYARGAGFSPPAKGLFAFKNSVALLALITEKKPLQTPHPETSRLKLACQPQHRFEHAA